MLLVADISCVADAVGFPWLIKSFEEKNVKVPAECSADTFLKESFRVCIIGFCCTIIGATGSRPSSFPVPNLDVRIWSRQVFNVGESLRQIIQICFGSVADWLTLPEGECVHKPTWQIRMVIYVAIDMGFNSQKLDSTGNQWIRSPIGIFVPAICCPDLDTREGRLDIIDFRQ